MNNLIENNIPDSKGYNAYIRDKSFAKLLEFYCGKDLFEKIENKFFELGKKVGEEIENLSITADKNPPQLIKKTRSGLSVNEILKHPDFKNLEKIAFGDFGLAAMSHRNGVFGFQEKLPPIIKYGLTFLFVQSEFGLCCPLSMTDSLTRTLKKFGNKDLVKTFFNKLTSQDMDNLFQGAMFMTEQEAGSDVGSIKTFAEQENKNWYLTGEKWFCSNPDADLAMVLARPKDNPSGTKGLSLFLLPKILQNGSHNSYEIIRLKEKLGGRNIFLIGMMGSGKSQTGPDLAKMINYAFVDTDDVIEKASKQSIAAIFEKDGELPYSKHPQSGPESKSFYESFELEGELVFTNAYLKLGYEIETLDVDKYYPNNNLKRGGVTSCHDFE